MSREKQDTISCVPLPHTHSEAMMMTLRPRSTRILLRKRKRRSFVRRGGRPRAEDKISPLCNEISTAPRRCFHFSVASTLCELWRRLRDSFTKLKYRLRHGRPSRSQSLSALLSPLRHVVGTSGPFLPDAILDTVRSLQERER